MLLHDSYFHSSNKPINSTHNSSITVAYSPLFHSTFTFIISICGLFFNLLCSIKIWLILEQYRRRKLKHTQEQHRQISTHVLSHHKYRFLLVLTINDCLLCLSSIVSCLDEIYFHQSLLARLHLCAAHILLWKFTLHFIPLFTIVILCRYHYILSKTFQVKSSNLSTLNQLLCTDLNILIAFVLALAWSVDGLWLWGVANIKDFVNSPLTPGTEYSSANDTIEIIGTSSTDSNDLNSHFLDLNLTIIRTIQQTDRTLLLPEQRTICYLQTNHNFEFSVRLIHLIEADFLLLFSFHIIGLLLELLLHMRLCCCVMINNVTPIFNHQRQLCTYVLYIFILITLTSLPFYSLRTLDILFNIQLPSMNNDFMNSRTFAQILLVGACFKPLLFFLLFFPSSILFYFKCYSPTNMKTNEHDEELLSFSSDPNHHHQQQQQQQQRESINYAQQQHRYSLHTHSSYDLQFESKTRTHSNPILPMIDHRQHSLSKTEQIIL